MNKYQPGAGHHGHETNPGHEHGHEKGHDPEVVTLTDDMVAANEADLQTKLAEKDQEIAELKDKYLRALADGENARKRIRQQSEESVRIQKEALLRDLLPIVDNLERAVSSARSGGSDGQIIQGVEMVLRSLLDFLRANGVTPIVSAGQPFDPSRHAAVDQVESSAHAPNTVIDEFHRGYLIGDRILRTAGVRVAKSPDSKRRNGEADDFDVEN